MTNTHSRALVPATLVVALSACPGEGAGCHPANGTEASLTAAAIIPAHGLPTFPGAEGFGAVATGGRGGRVLTVTTLAPSGPGSLQHALDQRGARIVVFAVSGVIEGDHTVQHGDVTIAGQSAPGGGITLAGRLTGAYDRDVQNIVVRHLRVRPHFRGGDGAQFDAIQFSRNRRLMLDHISVAWGVDETVDLYEAEDVTVQWSTIEESETQGHPEGAHNYGLINGPDGRRISLHHNLFAHHKNRCPAIANGPAEVANNVVYDVRHGFVHHNPATGPFNIVGNTFVRGPSSPLFPLWFDDENKGQDAGLTYYLADNHVDDPGVFVGVVGNPWQRPPVHPNLTDLYLPETHRAVREHTITAGGHVPVTTQPAGQAHALVLERAGAFPRDVVTRRTVDEVRRRAGSWGADRPTDLMSGLKPAAPPQDTDGDGMADAWETQHGLSPSDPDDHRRRMPSGYTAIEEYLNELAAAVQAAGG